MEELPQLVKASFEFSQEAHCNSTTDDYESLVIECESSLGIDGDGGCFFVLKTEQWSINDETDLKALFDRIKTIIQK